MDGPEQSLPPTISFPVHVMPPISPQETQVIKELPPEARDLVEYRWPNYLDAVEVKHSDTTFTITLMDLDYRHYTFVMNLSLDGRWTVCPISGFRYGGDDTLSSEGMEWSSNQ